MLNSILGSELTLVSFLICTAVSLVLGIATAFISMYRKKCSQSFAVTLAVLPAIVQIVIMLVNGNVGAGVAVAHGLGGREIQVVHRTVHTALPTAILSGAILTVAGLTYSETFLIMMGTPDTVLPLSLIHI